MTQPIYAFRVVAFALVLLCGCGGSSERRDRFARREAIVRDSTQLAEEIHDALSEVNDLASARAAAEPMESLTLSLLETLIELVELTDPRREFDQHMATLREKYRSRREAVIEGIRREAQRIAEHPDWLEELSVPLQDLAAIMRLELDAVVDIADAPAIDDGDELEDLASQFVPRQAVAFIPSDAAWNVQLLSEAEPDEKAALPLTLQSGSSPIQLLDFSADGNWLAGAAADGTIQVWDVKTGAATMSLRGHGDKILQLEFSPTGGLLLSADLKGFLQLWDVPGRAPKMTLKADSPGAKAAWSGDGKWLAVGRYRGIAIVDVKQRQIEQELDCAGFDQSLAYHHEKPLVLAARHNQMVLWDTSTGETVWEKQFGEDADDIRFVGFLPDGDIVAAAGFRKQIVLRTADGSQRDEFPLPGLLDGFDPTTRYCFASDHRRPRPLQTDPDYDTPHFDDTQSDPFARSPEEITVGLLPGWKPLRSVLLENQPSVAISRDGRLLATATAGGEVQLREVGGAEPQRPAFVTHELEGHQASVECVAFSADGKLVASGSEDRSVCVWEVLTGQRRRRFDGFPGEIRQVAFLPDRGSVVARTDKGTIYVLDVETGDRRDLIAEGDDPSDTEFETGPLPSVFGVSPIAPLLAVADSLAFETHLRLWDLDGGISIKTPPPTMSVKQLIFSPDGRQLAICGHGVVVVWDVTRGQLRHRFEFGEEVYLDEDCVAWSSDGGTIAVLDGKAETIRRWDTRTGEEFETIKTDVDLTSGIHFPPNGRVLAVRDAPGVQLLDARTGEFLLRLAHRNDFVRRVAFSPDGHAMATAGNRKNVVLWDVSGHCGPPLRPPGEIAADDGDPDGALKRAMRTWTSSRGGATVEARLVRCLAGKVLLEKADGTNLQVLVDRLSESDRAYIDSQFPITRDP